MIRAEYKDKNRIVDILTMSFDANKSVNYIVKQDRKRVQRLRKLMKYSFEVCFLFGDVFLSEDKNACALILLPDKKKTTFKSVLLDIKLIYFSTGVANISKALKRESEIKKHHPADPIYYLWFIGVDPNVQNKGIGSNLLQEIIQEGLSLKRKICLETSTEKNIPWYKKFGFSIYQELDFGYRLFCMKRE